MSTDDCEERWDPGGPVVTNSQGSNMSNILKIIIISVALGTVAWVLRMRVVEPDEIGRLCTGHAAPPWCELRQWLVAGFIHNYFGYASLLAVAAAVVFRARAPAWLALAAGILGCTLYRFEPSGAGVLLAALLLARADVRCSLPMGRDKRGSADEQA